MSNNVDNGGVHDRIDDTNKKLDRVIELLEQLVSAKTDGAMPGFERVYSYVGPGGGIVTYPANEPHYRKIE